MPSRGSPVSSPPAGELERYTATHFAIAMSIAPGIVVVDATFLQHLHKPESVARIESAARIAHLQICTSVLNVVEALKHPYADIRLALLEGIRRWSDGAVVNPHPFVLLRLAGEALRRGSVAFTIESRNIDLLVLNPAKLAEDHEKAVRFLSETESAFAKAYKDEKKAFQKLLKAEGRQHAWPTLADFLAELWSNPEMLNDTADVLWELAELSGARLEVDVLQKSEVWRLAFDALGAATYRRAIQKQDPRNPAGFVDLFQLLYMAQHTRARILITDDSSLYDDATQILGGRYINARVMRAAEFLERAG
jgi:hypothetical protein